MHNLASETCRRERVRKVHFAGTWRAADDLKGIRRRPDFAYRARRERHRDGLCRVAEVYGKERTYIRNYKMY